MPIPYVALLFIGLLLIAVVVEPVANRLRLPFSLLLVIVGYVFSEIVVSLGFDTGLRWHHFHDLIFFVFLPVLIFESAYQIDVKVLLRNLVPILSLAIPLMLFSTGITAVFIYYGIAHPTGFPWIAALLTGALLSATDPVAVLDLFKQMGVPARLSTLVEGESLLNDATAIVLFSLLLILALQGGEAVTWSGAIWGFLKAFFGGMLVGGVTGLILLLLLRRTTAITTRCVESVVGAFGAFLLAEVLFHVSGVMAVLVAGLLLGWAQRRAAESQPHDFLLGLWSFNAYIANAMIFLFLGITVTITMFTERWLAMLLGILAVLVARAVVTFGVLPLICKLPGQQPIGVAYQTVIYWGGLRGAVAVALALSLPLELEYWWTIQSIAYGVVLFTLFVQAPTMSMLIRRLHIKGDGGS